MLLSYLKKIWSLLRIIHHAKIESIDSDFGKIVLVDLSGSDIIIKGKNLRVDVPTGLIEVVSRFSSQVYQMSFSGEMSSELLDELSTIPPNENAFYSVMLRLKEVIYEHIKLGDIQSIKCELFEVYKNLYIDVASYCFSEDTLNEVEQELLTFVHKMLLIEKEKRRDESDNNTKVVSNILELHQKR